MKNIVIYNGHWCSGGAEAMLVNLLKTIGPGPDYKFTILATQKESDIFDEVLKEENIEFVKILNEPIKNPFNRTKKCINLFSSKISQLKPDVLHINCSNASGLKLAQIAKDLGVPKVIVHAHNASFDSDPFMLKRIMHNYWRKKYGDAPSVYLSCSKLAAKFMYPKQFQHRVEYIRNGVDVFKFEYERHKRNAIREELEIHEEYVIGHVGRFCKQKNHRFLLEIFKNILVLNPTAKLMLIGEGPLKKKIFRKIRSMGLSDSVIDVGVTKEVEKYYLAMDAFVLPSYHEGLPVSGVEAQAACLPTFFSNRIAKEAKILDSTQFFRINHDPLQVAYIILRGIIESNRKTAVRNIREAGFDIQMAAKNLEDIYFG